MVADAVAAEGAEAAEAAEAAVVAVQLLVAQLAAEAAARRGDVAAGASPGSFPTALTNAGRYGRVRQGRPGQCMCSLHR